MRNTTDNHTELSIYDVWFPCDFIMPPTEIPATQVIPLSDVVEVKITGNVDARHHLNNDFFTAYTYAGKWWQIPGDIEITHWRFLRD